MNQREYIKQKVCELIDNQFSENPLGDYKPEAIMCGVSFVDKSRKELFGQINLV
jgi:hypothetical protein